MVDILIDVADILTNAIDIIDILKILFDSKWYF